MLFAFLMGFNSIFAKECEFGPYDKNYNFFIVGVDEDNNFEDFEVALRRGCDDEEIHIGYLKFTIENRDDKVVYATRKLQFYFGNDSKYEDDEGEDFITKSYTFNLKEEGLNFENFQTGEYDLRVLSIPNGINERANDYEPLYTRKIRIEKVEKPEVEDVVIEEVEKEEIKNISLNSKYYNKEEVPLFLTGERIIIEPGIEFKNNQENVRFKAKIVESTKGKVGYSETFNSQNVNEVDKKISLDIPQINNVKSFYTLQVDLLIDEKIIDTKSISIRLEKPVLKDIKITQIVKRPSLEILEDEILKLELYLENNGNHLEENVKIETQIEGITEKQIIELEKINKEEKVIQHFHFKKDEPLSIGEYNINIKVYYDDGQLADEINEKMNVVKRVITKTDKVLLKANNEDLLKEFMEFERSKILFTIKTQEIKEGENIEVRLKSENNDWAFVRIKKSKAVVEKDGLKTFEVLITPKKGKVGNQKLNLNVYDMKDDTIIENFEFDVEVKKNETFLTNILKNVLKIGFFLLGGVSLLLLIIELIRNIYFVKFKKGLEYLYEKRKKEDLSGFSNNKYYDSSLNNEY